MLRYIRIVFASIVLTLSLLFFLDFAGILSSKLHALMHIQLIPAILSSSWVIVGVLLLSVVLFGRIYCSVICPFGIIQDMILWCKKTYLKIRYKGKYNDNTRKIYSPAYNFFRYSILTVTIVPVFFGSTIILTLLDPYSNFGRICMGILRPVYVWGNNILASLLNGAGNYSLYAVNQQFSMALFIFAVIVLIVLIALVLTNGRLWCNTICPVGGLFSLISRYSILKLRISESKCKHCNKCTSFCKSECIDHKNLKIDSSRCVVCFNCIGKCTKSAIKYDFIFCKTAANSTSANECEATQTNECDESRRRFLFGAATALAVAPLTGIASALGDGILTKRVYPLPPGAVPEFRNRCTGCQLCVSKCPMQLLRPSFLERGVSGIMQPHMYFKPHSYCNWECTICSEVCPNGALEKLSVEDKKIRQVGVVNFVKENCVVYKDNTDCGACSEHCPTQAVKMVEYKDALTIPQIEQSICIGCGACESICPERPNAIFISGIEPQGVAQKPEISEEQEIEVSGFGF